jgi:hypothetical protein
MHALVALLLLAACDGADPVKDAGEEPDADTDVDGDADGDTDTDTDTSPTDADGDGAAADVDCDDGDPDVFPGATEACNQVDDDCDGDTDEADASDAATWYRDADGDGAGLATDTIRACDAPLGYTDAAGDCDDADARAQAGADEVCDGVDDDCDGVVDEDDALDAAAFHPDDDADGYGDPAVTVIACAPPAGWVSDATDCDDGDATVSPGAEERCDEVDDDCDGTVDEPDAADAPTWYDDLDGDGYGDAAVATVACDAPAGAIADASDCDDGAAGVNPGAAEVCDAADLDEDCDGLADDEDDGVDVATRTTWYLDGDGDGYGASAVDACDAPATGGLVPGDCDDTAADVSPAGVETCDGVDQDCDGEVDEDPRDGTRLYVDADGDGYGDTADSALRCALADGWSANDDDCDDTDDAAYPGAPERCWNGSDDDCDGLDATDSDCGPDGTITSADVVAYGDSVSDGLGYAVALLRDLDGDSDDELAVASYLDDASAGSVYIHAGPIGSDRALATSEARITLEGDAAGDQLGKAVASAGDFDGDGFADVIAGAPGAERAYVFSGVSLWGTTKAASADLTLDGDDTGDDLGSAVAGVGDVDGDGYDDVLVGAPGSDEGSTGTGAAFLVRGGRSGTLALEDADLVLFGERNGDLAGAAVAGAGDPDGDGWPDLLVGAPGSDETGSAAGRAYLLRGPFSGTRRALLTADTVFEGHAAGDALGVSVAGLGDLDADGYDDVAVGATGYDGAASNAGGAGVWRGPVPPARLDLADADVLLRGEAASDGAGIVARAGDVDGDGWDDLLVGAGGNDGGGAGAGAAYLLYGPVSLTSPASLSLADAELDGTASDALGSALAGGADLDEDGYDDLVAGAYTATYTMTGNGEAWVLLGGSRAEPVATPMVPDLADDADGDGFSEDDGDCDDTRADESPDLAEVCEDGLDNDCDGQDARCALSGAVSPDDAPIALAAVTSPYREQSVDVVGDVNGDGYADVAVGEPDADTVRVFFGPLSTGDFATTDADLTLTAEAGGDLLGAVVVPAGDVDGDGIDDLLLGATGNDDAGYSAGKVYLVYGSVDLGGTVAVETAAALRLRGTAAYDYLGRSADAGDLDGDGDVDLALGAYGDDAARTSAGAVWIVPTGLPDGEYDVDDVATLRLTGEHYDDEAGCATLVADLDGDEVDDLVVGAIDDGKVWVRFGPITDTGTVSLIGADLYVAGAADVGTGGAAVDFAAGDLNGDGYLDLAFGGHAAEVYVLMGPLGPGERTLPDDADVDVSMETANDSYQGGVAVGDVNGDGWGDLVVGTPYRNVAGWGYAGGAYVVFGPLTGDVSLASADVEIDGLSRGMVGDVVRVGDVDADGFDDILVAAPYTDVEEVRILRGGVEDGATPWEAPAIDLADDGDGDGWTEAGGDCDDTRATVYPDAAETCEDAIDQDCDGRDAWCAPVGRTT